MPSYTEPLCSGIRHLHTIKCDSSVNFLSYCSAHVKDCKICLSASRCVRFDTGGSRLASGDGYELFYQHLPALFFLWLVCVLTRVPWKCLMALCWVMAPHSLKDFFFPLLSHLHCHTLAFLPLYAIHS